MRYVKLLRDGKGVWGVLQGDLVRTLTCPPFEEICYDGESLPVCQNLMENALKYSARTTTTTPWRWGRGCLSGPSSS